MRTILLFLMITNYLFAEDHTEFFTEPFETPQDVTTACLECHEDAAKQVMKTSHWTWQTQEEMLIPGHEQKQHLGKKNLFNNFCVHLNSNWPRCTSCHVGYGWKDDSFDFTDEKNVDCLVCHDQTGLYVKTPAGAGMPDKNVDLLKVAQNVGTATRQSCGTCHFYGGGGDNVKHGDLEPALINPTTDLDVHMGANEMVCQDCHTVENHQMQGIALSVTAIAGEKQVECAGCHDSNPHESQILNNHYEKIACQTCHIPAYAKELPTKLTWDWSTAGQDLNVEKDENGKPLYSKKKGNFTWGKDVVPEYLWYNGSTNRYLLGDKINEDRITQLNFPLGKKEDKNARIFPFKVHRGKQISDSKNKYLIVPQLYGGYWKYFDWNKAAENGMASVGLDYSGSYDFVETEMYWRINHEVSSSEKALQCNDCHVDNGRLNWKDLGYDGNPVSPEELKKYIQ